MDSVKQDPIEIRGEILGSISFESMALVVLLYFRLFLLKQAPVLCCVVLTKRGLLS